MNHRAGSFRALIAFLIFASTTLPRVANSADEKPVRRGGTAVDYPLGLVAFASVDRLLARADSVAEATGESTAGGNLIAAFLGGGDDEEIQKLLNSPGLDKARPFGIICYPRWFSGDKDAKQSDSSLSEKFDEDPVNYLAEQLVNAFTENSTLVICVPTNDRLKLLDTIREILGKELVKVEAEPGWLTTNGKDRVGFVANYLVLTEVDNSNTNLARNYPDFEKLAKGSLGKNGFVYALYRKGLPPLVRDTLAPAFKMAFAARFQQQDNEPEVAFRLRTMFGNLQMELVELLLSDVEEFRIGGHVDNGTRTIHVEPELVGPKDGKFAKYCRDLMPKQSPFSTHETDAGTFVATISLPLPQKSWKPVSEALYGLTVSMGRSEAAEVIRTLARTVELGQLDLHTSCPNPGEVLLAIRIAENANFPEALQEMIARHSDPPVFQLGVESVEGIPIHRTLTTVETGPELLNVLLASIVGKSELQMPVYQSVEATEVEVETQEERVGKDGVKSIITKRRKEAIPGAKNSIWLAATPRSICLGIDSSPGGTCPEWFKSQLAASLAKPTGTATANRARSCLRVILRGLGASPAETKGDDSGSNPSEIQRTSGTDRNEPGREKASAAESARGNLLRDLPNAIRCELRSTETGLKIAMEFEEAYFQWFATFVKDSIDESSAANKKAAGNEKSRDGKPASK